MRDEASKANEGDEETVLCVCLFVCWCRVLPLPQQKEENARKNTKTFFFSFLFRFLVFTDEEREEGGGKKESDRQLRRWSDSFSRAKRLTESQTQLDLTNRTFLFLDTNLCAPIAFDAKRRKKSKKKGWKENDEKEKEGKTLKELSVMMWVTVESRRE